MAKKKTTNTKKQTKAQAKAKSSVARKNQARQTTAQTVAAEKKVGKDNKVSRLRGMKDITFNDYKYWDLILKKANDLASAFSFQNIEVPALERQELYEKSLGADSPFFLNEVYTFTDKNRDKAALRPSATPGLARSYLEYGLYNLRQPVKVSWMGPVFRQEKTQSGKYRQFHQFNLEIYGEENPIADFLLIMIAYRFFSELQIGTQVQINSWGCEECREEYLEKLKKYYRNKRTKLCAECKKKVSKAPLDLLKCDKECCQELKEEAPPIVDFLCEKCQTNFTKILENLDEMEIPYNLNPCLIRDLDYYNYGPVFEFWDLDENDEPQAGFNLGGGGRFDKLVESLGGKPTPACGFALGLERTLLKMKKNNIPIDGQEENVVFLAQLGEQARRKMLTLFEEFRKSGFAVKQAFTRDSLKEQLEEAEEAGAKITLILGQKEVNDNTILLRDMESGNQEVVDYKKIRSEIEKRLKNNG